MCQSASLRLELSTVTKIQTWFVFSLIFFVANVFVSKQEIAGIREKDRSSKDILLVSNDGPTTLGDISTFNARIELAVSHNTLVKSKCSWTLWKFCWFVEKKFINCSKLSATNQSTLKYGHWKSPGRKMVTVNVLKSRQYGRCFNSQKIQSHSGFPYSLKNSTTILVTDSINLDLTVWQGLKKPRETPATLFVGEVQIQASIHGHLFDGHHVRYLWDFGNKKVASSHCPNQSYIYKEDKKYNLSLTASSFVKGRFYTGSFAVCLDFRVLDFDERLVVHGQPGPKLAPHTALKQNTYLLAPGKVIFVLEYKDPYSLVEYVSTDWKIDGYHFEKWPNNTFSYNISRLGSHIMWVTYRIYTKHKHFYYGLKSAKLLIKEPILHLNVSHTPNIPKRHSAVFHITCQGSGPVSFCWSIARNCRLPNTSSCIPTIERSKCYTVVNHTFSNPGAYCLNVSVMNTVSSAGTYLKILIPEDGSQPSNLSVGPTTAEVLLSILVFIFMVFGVVFLVKNYYASSKKPVEKANFDFRDEDCRSVSSLNIGSKITGCWYRLDQRIHNKNKQDLILLLESHDSHYGSVNYKPKSMYI